MDEMERKRAQRVPQTKAEDPTADSNPNAEARWCAGTLSACSCRDKPKVMSERPWRRMFRVPALKLPNDCWNDHENGGGFLFVLILSLY